MRKVMAWVGVICLFSAAGTDQRCFEMGQVPPESVEQLIIIGLLLLMPTIFRRRKIKK